MQDSNNLKKKKKEIKTTPDGKLILNFDDSDSDEDDNDKRKSKFSDDSGNILIIVFIIFIFISCFELFIFFHRKFRR